MSKKLFCQNCGKKDFLKQGLIKKELYVFVCKKCFKKLNVKEFNLFEN